MPKWGKGDCPNPRGRPPDLVRHKALIELIYEAEERLQDRQAHSALRSRSTLEAVLEEAFHRAIKGSAADARLILKLAKEFQPKFSYFVPQDGLRWIEFPLTQDIVDGWHEKGWFPPGTPRFVEEISEELLNRASRSWRESRSQDDDRSQ